MVHGLAYSFELWMDAGSWESKKKELVEAIAQSNE